MSLERVAWLGETASDQAEDEAIVAYIATIPRPERELREEAAKLIEKRGWSREVWHRPTGEICMEEALNIVCRHASLELVDSLKFRLERELGCVDLTQWQDVPERTVEEVLAALRGMAA